VPRSRERVPITTRRALVTGISGFVGSHLAEYLTASGWEVHGFDRAEMSGPERHDVRMHTGDLLDLPCVEHVVSLSRPTHVFHLAAVISDGPSRPYEVNVVGTAHLFAALRASSSTARVLVSSSSAVYGQAETLPITEAAPLRPATDYAASKAGQEMVAVAHQIGGADVVRVRPFNLIGPRQPGVLVTSAIARQIAEAEQAGRGTIRIGHATTRRDYTDVRDAVRAYVAVAEDRKLCDVYNVCSGRSVSITECLDLLRSMSSVPLDVEFDTGRVRAHDIEEQVGSAERLVAATGWRPQISIEESLVALLEECRSSLKAGDDGGLGER
jgi:GDP-4-dehydro-6-deoxy-D-mannose reductase